MSARITVRAVSIAALAFAAVSMPQAHAASDLYTHLTLLNPEQERHVANAYILVENGRIVSVGVGRPRVASSTRIHDMAGRYALPGFIDAHAHITAGPH